MNDVVSANELTPEKNGYTSNPGFAGKLYSGFFSYIFHPIFVPLYVVAFLVYFHPSAFAGFSAAEKKQTLLIVTLNLVLFPLLSVMLTKAVGFIDSIFLRTQKDRIIPYILCGIFFFWAFQVFYKQPQYPLLLSAFILGIFLASSLALIANIYFKISMHALGMGGWLGFFLIIFKTNGMLMTWPVCAVLLITGLVCSARLLISSHQPRDIYAGLFAGILTQVIAAMVIL